VRIEQAAPVLLSTDLERTAARYRAALGWEFALFGDPPNFGIASHDAQRVMYARTATPVVPNWHVVRSTWNLYIRVDVSMPGTPSSSAGESSSTTASAISRGGCASSACRIPTATT
jgi:hypothetical protein